MAKRVALNKRDREKMRERLLARRAELLADLDGTDSDGCWYLAIDGERTRWWDRNGRIDSGGNEVTYVAP